MKDLFTARDRFVHLEPVPSSIIGTKDLVGRKIKFEDLACLVSRPGREHPDHKIGKDSKEEDNEYRNVRDDKHRGNNDHGESVLPFLPDRVREPFL
jgi:hypothetical protein